MDNERVSRVTPATIMVLLLSGSVFLAFPSQAGFEEPDEVLPRATLHPAVVWADDIAYIIGGIGASARIQSYDPETGDTELLDLRLPHGISVASAVWDGEAIYVFGGRKDYDFLDTIYRVDPAAETVTLMDARLVEPLAGTRAVWTGDAAYVLGGYRDCIGGGCWLYTDAIQRYDPATDTLTVMETTLWHPAQKMGVTWTGEHIVIVGGHQCYAPGYTCRYSQLIEQYDPATDSMVPTFASLPMGTVGLRAVWDGQSIFLLSGVGFDTTTYQFHPYKEIRRLVPSIGITPTASELPFDDDGFGVVWSGDRVLMLGGRSCAFNAICFESDKIWHYDPRPQPPVIDAHWGTHVGDVRLEWEPVAPEAYPLNGYRIWRGTSADNLRPVDEVGPDATSYEDTPPLPIGTYHYAVTATDEGGYESVKSNIEAENPAPLPSFADRNGNGIPDGLEYP